LEALKAARGQAAAGGRKGGGANQSIDFAGDVAYARDMEMSSSLRSSGDYAAAVPQSAFSGANGDSLSAGEETQVMLVQAS
jgi:hypothetical protein